MNMIYTVVSDKKTRKLRQQGEYVMNIVSLVKKITFAVYLGFLIFILIINRGVRMTIMPYWDCIKTGVNIVPLSSFVDYIRIGAVNWKVSAIYLSGSIALFIPFGVLAPLLWTKLQKYGVLVGWTILVRLVIELAQLFTTRGLFDVDDFILSCVGITIGFLVQKGLVAVYDNKRAGKAVA